MIAFRCPNCQAPFSVPDDKAGKSGKCPKCQTKFSVPAPSARPQPRDEDEEPPRKKAVRPRDEDEEDDRPRKKAARREEADDEEERPREKQRADTDEDRQAKGRTPKAVLSPLDRALKTLRRSQFLDLAAVGALLLVGIAVALVLTVFADSWQEARAAEWKAASAKYHDDVSASMRNPQRIPFPDPPAVVLRGEPRKKDAARDMLAERGWLYLLFAVPALVMATGSAVSAVGRFRLAALAAGSGGARGFAAVGVLSLGRLLLGLAAVGGCIWAMTQIGGASDGRDRAPELVAASVGGLILALYWGVLGEVLSLPSLALIGWSRATTDAQRHRIGTAAAFYPVIVVAWFLLTLVFGAVGYFVPDMIVVLGILQAVLFLVIQVVQYLVVSRAYRFPAAEDRVS